jgi:hypothetical protein
VIDADYIVGVVGMMIEIGEIGGRGKGAIEVIGIVLIEEIGKVVGNTSKSSSPQLSHLTKRQKLTCSDDRRRDRDRSRSPASKRRVL